MHACCAAGPVIFCSQTKKAELEESQQQLTEAQTALTELQASFEQVGKGVLRQTHACAFRHIFEMAAQQRQHTQYVPKGAFLQQRDVRQAAVAHRRTRCP